MGKQGQNKFCSIKFRLSVSYVIMIAFIALSGLLAECMGERAIKEKYKDTVAQSLNMLGKYIEFGFENVQGTAVEYLMDRDIGDYVSGKMASDSSAETRYRDALEKELSTKITADAFISDVYFLTEGVYAATTKSRDIRTLFSSYMESEQGQQVRDNENQFFWLGQSSIVDDELEVDSRQYAVRLVKYFNQKNAVMMIDIASAKITEMLSEIDLGEGSRIAYVTNDGVELTQNGARETFFTSMELYGKICTLEADNGTIENVELEGQNYLYLYERLQGEEGMICAVVPNDVIYAEIYAIRKMTVAVVIAACIFALIIGGGITISFTRSIQYFIQKVGFVAEGRIDTKLYVRTKDEFYLLAQHMNQMLDSVRRFLQQAKNMSVEVAATVEQVTNTAKNVTESANFISDEISEIESGLTRQAEDARQTVYGLENLAGQIETVESDTKEIRGIADATKAAIRENVTKMEVLKDRAETANGITKNVISSIRMLSDRTDQISRIVDTMNEISDETSLLSLNASIEAARAGEAGKGFAVVADSIKKLAEQSASSANDIKSIVKMILDDTMEVVRITGQAEQTMQEQKQSVRDSQISFETMESEVRKLLEKVDFIIQNVAKMQQDKAESMENMQSISAVTEEVVASVSVVNKRTGNQVETIVNLEKLSEKMQGQMLLLNETMEYFSMDTAE